MTFRYEKEIQEKMDTLMDLSEALAPSLDLNDRSTLKESIQNLNQKLTNVTAAANKQGTKLEAAATALREFQVGIGFNWYPQWKTFQAKMNEVTSALDATERSLKKDAKTRVYTVREAQNSISSAEVSTS